MGYKPNYVASSLKRKTIQFAILLPAPSLTNRYFYRDLWKGLRDFKAEVQQFNVKFLEFTFSGSGSSQAKELENIYNLYADDLSGLITIALNDASISYFIDKFTAKNIPVVLISSDMQKSKRLCCVRAHDKIAGKPRRRVDRQFLKRFRQSDCRGGGRRHLFPRAQRGRVRRLSEQKQLPIGNCQNIRQG
jgi:LacI family transcriptional regulator